MIAFELQEKVLKDVSERLESLGLHYMLSGSMAMVKYGMHRMTNDIDIVVELSEKDLSKFLAEFQDDFYIPPSRALESVRTRRMFNMLNNKDLVKVDVIIRKDEAFDRIAFENRTTVVYTSFPVSIISRDDLIVSKLRWGKDSMSEKQISDVAGIIRNGYDEDYVNSWAKKLNLEDILARAIDKLENDHAQRY